MVQVPCQRDFFLPLVPNQLHYLNFRIMMPYLTNYLMKDETKNRSNGSKYTLLFSQALTRVSVILLAALLCFPLDSSGNDNLRWSRTKPTVKASTTKMLVLGDTGPQTAGDADDNDCGSGSGWASEASAEGGDDGNRAEVDLSDNEISDCLDLSSFGLSVPGGATILDL